MKIWNNFWLSGLILLLVSSCKDPVKTRHLVYFVDDDFWESSERGDLFWEKVAQKIQKAGEDGDIKTIELTIYSIGANGPQNKVSRVIDSEKEPALKTRPNSFSQEYVDELRPKCTSGNSNGIVHIAPTLALIRSAWKKCLQDINREVEIVYVSNMTEQTDALESSDGRYNFLLKSPHAINIAGVDEAIKDVQNEHSPFYKHYILPNKEDYGALEIHICKPGNGITPDYDRVERYWYECFGQIGIEEGNVRFRDSVTF